MSRPFVSVIMPVLNGMPYFKQALESVLEQTLQALEVIVVDAFSTDGTREFVRERQAWDARLIMIDSDKRSTGRQGNLGVMASQGQYIAFCESDDYLDRDYLLRLKEVACEHNFPDMVKSDFDRFAMTDSGMLSLRYGVLPPNQRDRYGEILNLEKMPELLQRDFNMWNGLYRTEFLRKNNICQNETPGAAFQDTGFTIQTQLLAETEIFLREGGYHNRRDNQSSSLYKRETGLFALQELEFMLGWLDGHPQIKEKWSAAVLRRAFGTFRQFYGANRYEGCAAKYEQKVDRLNMRLQTFLSDGNEIWQQEVLAYAPLAVYMQSPDEFRKGVDEQEKCSHRQQADFAKRIKDEPAAVIFGAGELGACIAALLLLNGYVGEISFCDNSTERCGRKIMDFPVSSPAQAVQDYPGVFILPQVSYAAEMYSQLRELGIQSEKIVQAPDVSVGSVFGIEWDRERFNRRRNKN